MLRDYFRFGPPIHVFSHLLIDEMRVMGVTGQDSAMKLCSFTFSQLAVQQFV